MPFKSEKQRRFLHANHPEIAKRWENNYNLGGNVMGRGLLDKMDDDITITKKNADGASITIKSPKGTQVDLSGILGNMLEEGLVEGPDMGPVADNVTARLTPGEHVINRPAAEKYRPLLEQINNEGKMMLAMGGHIPGYFLGGETLPDGYMTGPVPDVNPNAVPQEDLAVLRGPIDFNNSGTTATYGPATNTIPGIPTGTTVYADTGPGGPLNELRGGWQDFGGSGGTTMTSGQGDISQLNVLPGDFAFNLGGPVVRDHDRLVWLRQLLETLEPGTRDYEMVKSLILNNPKGYNVGGNVQHNPQVMELIRRAQGGDEHAARILDQNGIAWNTPVDANAAGAIQGSLGDESVSPTPVAPQPETTWTPEAPEWQFNPEHDVSVTPQPSETPWVEVAKLLQADDGSLTKQDFDGKVDNDTRDAAAAIVGGSQTPQDVLSRIDSLADEAKTLEEKRRSMKLFALGLSMLGGKNAATSAQIANGIANASDHKIEELYSRRKDLLAAVDAKLLKDAGYETVTGGRSGYSRPFNIEFRDENGQLEVRAGRLGDDGAYLIQNEEGEWVPAPTDARVTNRSADPAIEIGPGGIPNADSFSKTLGIPSFTFQREGEQKVYGYALRAIIADKKMSEIEKDIPTGKLASLYAGLANWARTNASGKITAGVLNSIIGDAGLTQYGREMQKYLQAILRTDTGAAYTGTEIADYLSAFGVTPGEAIDENTLRSIQEGRFNELFAITGRAGKASPYLIGLLEGEYDLPNFDRLPRGDVGSVESGGKNETNTTQSGVTWSIE